MDLGAQLAERTSAVTDPELIAAPATDTYAIVLVDLGAGVNMTAAQAQARLTSAVAADRSFASYYAESSYGKYMITGTVLGPYPYTMTTCNTSGMATAIEAMIPATPVYNHLIYYFNQTNLCAFGGLGEEGSTARPSKRTWMNGSLGCVVLMQEPGHNLGLMHANTMKCGTGATATSFSTTPATSCTITEYGSQLSTMGGGCRTLNAYERWYMQWMTGCNGVKVPGAATINLLPLESPCPGGVQVLQVPFPAPLTVSDPQSTGTTVNLRNYYVELRTQSGGFDTYSTTGGGRQSSVTFTAPTVFIYTSDDVRIPTTTGRGGGQNSVWTELLTMAPTGTTFTGLTTAGQSFVDPAGGPTITLRSISAAGAVIDVTNPSAAATAMPTCIDGTMLTLSGPTTCGGVSTGVGGAPGGTDAGVPGTGGAVGGTGGVRGTGGTPGAGVGGSSGGTGGMPGTTTGTGGSSGGPAGTGGAPLPGVDGGAPHDVGTVTGGCGCNVPTGTAPLWTSVAAAVAVGLLRRRRRTLL
jgi:hypothetical protein